MINLDWINTFWGPSPYSKKPVVVGRLTIEPQAQLLCSQRCDDFLEKILTGHFDPMLSGLSKQTELQGLAGKAFADKPVVEKLGRVCVHWALAALNERRGDLQAGGVSVAHSVSSCEVWLGFHDPGLSRTAFRLAVEWLLAPDQEQASQAKLAQLWQLCYWHHPDYQARILLEAAQSKSIPAFCLSSTQRIWQFGWGAKSRLFFESSCNSDGLLGAQIAQSKAFSKEWFQRLGAPVARSALIVDRAQRFDTAKQIGFPCVLKPLDAGGGKGVTANIRNEPALSHAFDLAKQYTTGPIMCEAHIPGDDHRLFVVNGQFVAAIKREPAKIVGDGVHSVEQLIARLNRTRSLNMVASNYLRPVKVDEVLLQQLKTQSVSLEDVLPDGECIALRSNANLSTGGICTNLTEIVHSSVVQMAETLAQASGIAICGLDYMTTDISKSWAEVDGAFIELNTTPGLDTMIAAGMDSVKIGRKVLGDELDRIPVMLAVVDEKLLSNLAEWLSSTTLPKELGWVCGTQVGLGNLPLQTGEKDGWSDVETILSHTTVKRALLVVRNTRILECGLPLEWVDKLELFECDFSKDWQRTFNDVATNVEYCDNIERLQANIESFIK